MIYRRYKEREIINVKKLKKEMSGHYYFENDEHEIVHIYKIDRDLWGYSIGKSMAKDTFKSLREARYKLMYKSNEVIK